MADNAVGSTLKRQRSNSNDGPPNSSDKRQNTGTPVVKREPGAAVKLEEGEGGVEGGKSASAVKMEVDSSNASAAPADNNGTAPATGAASLPAAPVAATAAQQPASASTEAAAPHITIRALIVTGDASIIIGKGE